ncbi:MAG: hypothetical protein RBR73_05045, partial [Halothiobacillaceae bacterium]|nr:hypothetical protein [Halothiobacillaceae bacterium]
MAYCGLWSDKEPSEAVIATALVDVIGDAGFAVWTHRSAHTETVPEKRLSLLGRVGMPNRALKTICSGVVG